jgi:hypothetical protein
MQYDLKRMCANCPFRKEGAINLMPGRLASIVDEMKADDHNQFACHKTVHNRKTGGDWTEDADGNTRYEYSGKESACMGSVAYLAREGHTSVQTRVALATKAITMDCITATFPDLIDKAE